MTLGGRCFSYMLVTVLVAGGCHDEPGRRSASESSSTSSVVQPTSSTTRPATQSAERWERVEIDSPDNSHFDAGGVEVVGGRLIASGSGGFGCCDDTTIAWESADGRSWRPYELPQALDGQRFTGAHAKAGDVAVGDWITLADCREGLDPGLDSCRPVAAAWWSDRSGRWNRVPDDPAVFGAARMEHVWKRPDGYTALGHLLDPEEQPAAPMIWRSRDGRRWRRQAPIGPIPVEATTVQLPQSIVALTGRQAWQSTGGITWERTAVLGEAGADIKGAGFLYRAGTSALVVFDRLSPERHSRLEVHWSADGRQWRALGDAFGAPTPKPTYISAVRTLRQTIVAVGAYNAEPTMWESHDGRQWRRRDLTDEAFAGAWVSDITEFDRCLILVGGVGLPAGNKPRAQPIAWRTALTGPLDGGGRPTSRTRRTGAPCR